MSSLLAHWLATPNLVLPPSPPCIASRNPFSLHILWLGLHFYLGCHFRLLRCGLHVTDAEVFRLMLLLAHRVKPTHTMVNCWFCNHDTLVPYGNRNCWDCPHCEQYNGFQEVWAVGGWPVLRPLLSWPELTLHATVF